jgi:alpha-amylase
MIMRRIAEKSYLPMNEILMQQIKEYGNRFKVTFSISGLAIEQMEFYSPEVLESFKKLVATGQVEILAETYAHSLSSLKDPQEFERQVKAHTEKIEQVFGVRPVSFRNTELIYSDTIGAQVAEMGFKVMLTEGAKHVLGWKSPNYMYANAINPKLKVLLRNFRLSDDIAFRFSQQSWSEWPVTAEKFVGWLDKINPNEEVVNLFMDYETFGEHQWASSGIFNFMKALPGLILKKGTYSFSTPELLADKLQPVSAIHVPYPISWADEERDLTAWLGNDMQDESFAKLYALGETIRNGNDAELIRDWNYLQSSDHFYYMCTKWFSDGDVHKYFNHYSSPYEAYINYMNVLSDFQNRVNKKYPDTGKMFQEVLEKSGQIVKQISTQANDVIGEIATKAKTEIRKGEKKIKPVFEDIKNLSDARIKKLIHDMEAEDLVAALKDAEQELVNRVIPNMSKSARKKYEELEQNLKVKKNQVNQIRKTIEDKLRGLI